MKLCVKAAISSKSLCASACSASITEIGAAAIGPRPELIWEKNNLPSFIICIVRSSYTLRITSAKPSDKQGDQHGDFPLFSANSINTGNSMVFLVEIRQNVVNNFT